MYFKHASSFGDLGPSHIFDTTPQQKSRTRSLICQVRFRTFAKPAPNFSPQPAARLKKKERGGWGLRPPPMQPQCLHHGFCKDPYAFFFVLLAGRNYESQNLRGFSKMGGRLTKQCKTRTKSLLFAKDCRWFVDACRGRSSHA